MMDLVTRSIRGMAFLNEVRAEYADATSFATGSPSSLALARLPWRDLAKTMAYGKSDGANPHGYSGNEIDLLQYGPSRGIINESVAEHLRTDFALKTAHDQLLITAGCQEALAICLAAVCSEPNDIVLFCNPTYPGIHGAASCTKVGTRAVVTKAANSLAQNIEISIELCRAESVNPRAIYLIPTFDNPTGELLSWDERLEVLQVCARERVLIIEDHAYGMLRYDGPEVPPMAHMDMAGGVIFVNTFSKTIAPTLRVGAIRVPGTLFGEVRKAHELLAALVDTKSRLSINTNQIGQAIVGGVLSHSGYSLKAWIAEALGAYDRNRRELLTCLERSLAHRPRVSWNQPQGGFFVTLNVPFVFDEATARRCASEKGVIATPMCFFSNDDSQDLKLRLSFSSVPYEGIRRGIHGLAEFIDEECGHTSKSH